MWRYILSVLLLTLLFPPLQVQAQIAYAVGGVNDSTGTYGRIVKTTDPVNL